MTTARGRHTATDLKNGTVLVAGGYDDQGKAIASAELYDVAKGTFSATGSMATARWRHAETRLLNGDVLITGGKNETTAVKTAELFNAQVAPNGVIWLQRDGSGSDPSFATLARELARQTNSIVVAPKFGSLENPGPSVSGAGLQDGVAELFNRHLLAQGIDRPALNRSATAAGFQGPLPQKFLLAGLGKGGGFVTSVGAVTVDNGSAENLLGVVMVDGFADAVQFAASIAKLDSLDIPNYQIAGPPSASNAWGRTTDQIAALHPGQFVGIETPLGAHDAVITASAGWINDIYAGYGPTDPKFGVYGNPNDGTFVPGQRFTIGGVTATVLSTDGEVDVVGTRGKSVTVDAMSYRDLTGTTFTAFVSTGIAASAPPVVRPTVTVVSASPGKIRVSLSAAQTAALTPAKTYYLFLRESHSDGTVRTRVAGTVKVRNASP